MMTMMRRRIARLFAGQQRQNSRAIRGYGMLKKTWHMHHMSMFSTASYEYPGSREGKAAAESLDRIEGNHIDIDALDKLAHDAATRMENLSGSDVTNVLGTLALAQHWDAEVFTKALHRSNLRTKKFGFLDQVALYHVDVALETQLSQNAGRLVLPKAEEQSADDSPIVSRTEDFPTLPVDVMMRCRNSERRYHEKALPIYSSLHTRLRRQGVEAVYQHVITGLDGGKEYYVAHVAVPSERVVIVVDGEWNQIPGTHSLSLSSRLYDWNLYYLGWTVHHMSQNEWDKAQQQIPRVGGEDPTEKLTRDVYDRAISDNSKTYGREMPLQIQHHER